VQRYLQSQVNAKVALMTLAWCPQEPVPLAAGKGAPGVLKTWTAKPTLPNKGIKKLVVRSKGPQTDSDGYLR